MRTQLGFVSLIFVLAMTSAFAMAGELPAVSSSADAVEFPPHANTQSQEPAEVVIDAEAIRAHYANVVAFTADVDQEKKAPFLARPLKSVARLSMNGGRIEWRTISPVASFVAIDSEGIHLESQSVTGGAAETMKSAGKDPRATAFIGFLRALFALDFPGIERDFSLVFEGGVMRARPKATSSLGTMIRGIDVVFSEDLSVRRVVVETKDETTTMNFRNFTSVTRP